MQIVGFLYLIFDCLKLRFLLGSRGTGGQEQNGADMIHTHFGSNHPKIIGGESWKKTVNKFSCKKNMGRHI